MQVVKDRFKNDVAIGDILLHVVKKSSTVSINYVIVYGMKINRSGDIVLNVHAAKQYYGSKQFFTYKTHVRVDTGIVKLTNDVPVEIKTLLYHTIGKSL